MLSSECLEVFKISVSDTQRKDHIAVTVNLHLTISGYEEGHDSSLNELLGYLPKNVARLLEKAGLGAGMHRLWLKITPC